VVNFLPKRRFAAGLFDALVQRGARERSDAFCLYDTQAFVIDAFAWGAAQKLRPRWRVGAMFTRPRARVCDVCPPTDRLVASAGLFGDACGNRSSQRSGRGGIGGSLERLRVFYQYSLWGSGSKTVVREGLQGGTRIGLLSVFLGKKNVYIHSYVFTDRVLLINSWVFVYLPRWLWKWPL